MSSPHDTNNTVDRDNICHASSFDNVWANESPQMITARSFDSIRPSKEQENGMVANHKTIFESVSDYSSEENGSSYVDKNDGDVLERLPRQFNNGAIKGMTADTATINNIYCSNHSDIERRSKGANASDYNRNDNVPMGNDKSSLGNSRSAIGLILDIPKVNDRMVDSISVSDLFEDGDSHAKSDTEKVDFLTLENFVKIIIAGPLIAIFGIIVFVGVSRVTSLTASNKVLTGNNNNNARGGTILSIIISQVPSQFIAPSFKSSASQPIIASTSPSNVPSHKRFASPPTSSIPTPAPTFSLVPSISSSSSLTYTPIIFYVLGNAPFSTAEKTMLYSQLYKVPEDAQFLVHIGGIREAGKDKHTKCKKKEFVTVQKVLKSSDYPMFIIPGYNDIHNCSNIEEAQGYWDTYFHSFEDNWEHSLPVQRQTARQENFSFFLGNVLFIGLNIVRDDDITNLDSKSSRLKDNLDWSLGKINEFRDSMVGLVIFGHGHPKGRHDEFFATVATEIEILGVPSVYIHGDGQEYELKEKSFGVKNMQRIQVDRGGIAAPLKVEFRRDAASPFEFVRNYRVRSHAPSVPPTHYPYRHPTYRPISLPTAQPTTRPTSRPTPRPTSRPTTRPTSRPTSLPTPRPTSRPTTRPTLPPSSQPSYQPTFRPTFLPSSRPSTPRLLTHQPMFVYTTKHSAGKTPKKNTPGEKHVKKKKTGKV